MSFRCKCIAVYNVLLIRVYYGNICSFSWEKCAFVYSYNLSWCVTHPLCHLKRCKNTLLHKFCYSKCYRCFKSCYAKRCIYKASLLFCLMMGCMICCYAIYNSALKSFYKLINIFSCTKWRIHLIVSIILCYSIFCKCKMMWRNLSCYIHAFLFGISYHADTILCRAMA